MSLPEFKTRRIETWKKNLGVDNSFKSPIVREHHRRNCLKNHGVEYSAQRSDVKLKYHRTTRRNQYTRKLMTSEYVKPLFTVEQFELAKRDEPLWWQCLNEDCEHVFAASYKDYFHYLQRPWRFCPFCRPPF